MVHSSVEKTAATKVGKKADSRAAWTADLMAVNLVDSKDRSWVEH